MMVLRILLVTFLAGVDATGMKLHDAGSIGQVPLLGQYLPPLREAMALDRRMQGASGASGSAALLAGRKEVATHKGGLAAESGTLLGVDQSTPGGRATANFVHLRSHLKTAPSQLKAQKRVYEELNFVTVNNLLVVVLVSFTFLGGAVVAGILSYLVFGREPLPTKPLPPLHGRGGFPYPLAFQQKDAPVPVAPTYNTQFPADLGNTYTGKRTTWNGMPAAKDFATRPM